MKVQYVKPEVYFESFSLTQTIARNCGDTHNSTLGQSTHPDEYECMWDVGGFTYFMQSNGCDDGPEDAEDYEENGFELEAMCYNNPDGGQEIFSSY